MNPVPPIRDAIDWQQVRNQLAQAAEATERATHLSPERARMVLEERARALARVAPTAPTAGEVLQVVVFCLGDERYALETSCVREVAPLHDCTPLPGAPAFVFGVVNLRGEVLCVMDLRPFCGIPPRERTDRSRVLVLGGSRSEFGLLADDVLEVAPLRRVDVLAAPASIQGAARDYLLGVTPEATIVLDGAVLLRDSRLFVDQADEG